MNGCAKVSEARIQNIINFPREKQKLAVASAAREPQGWIKVASRAG